MTTKLIVWNAALRLCQERALATLTENREPQRLLSAAWDGGVINYCLEQGQWNFAIRSSKLEYAPTISPSFGYARAFEKPDDYIRLVGFGLDPYFNVPLNQYQDESGFWFADNDEIYVRYVSNDNAYGNDLSLWPESFTNFVQAYLASQIIGNLAHSDNKIARVIQSLKESKYDALNKDAIETPQKFQQLSSWAGSRSGRTHRDGGNRNKLIG